MILGFAIDCIYRVLMSLHHSVLNVDITPNLILIVYILYKLVLISEHLQYILMIVYRRSDKAENPSMCHAKFCILYV